MEDSIDFIASQGVDGIEFSGLDDGRPSASPLQRADALRQKCERHNLPVISYCTAAELLRPRAAQRAEIERVKREVDVAAALGVPSMRHDVTRGFGDNARGLRIPKTFDAALKVLVPAIREIANYAATKNVKTSLENHGFFMQASRRVERLIRAVGHENFGLTLDMGNFLCVNEDPLAAVKRLARYAIMVHVKDFHVRPKSSMPATGWFATPTKVALRGAIVGHGVIDVARQIEHMRRVGYDGYLSLEFEGMEDPLTAVKLGLDALRKLI
jgi:sugar phosphate isomerase/epimerase